MPPDALLSLILLPLATLACLLVSTRRAFSFLRPRVAPNHLLNEHWSVQNRYFWEFHILRHYLRFVSLLLVGAVLVFLYYQTRSVFVSAAAALLLFGLFLQSRMLRSFVTSIRQQWDRVDLTPFQSPLRISLLFQIPTVLLVVSLFFIPREFSLSSLGIVGGIVILFIGWYGWGIVGLARLVGTVKEAPEEISNSMQGLAKEMGMAREPAIYEMSSEQINAFAFVVSHCVVFTTPLLHYFPSEQVFAIGRHELGHLCERRLAKVTRLAYPLVFLPLLLIRPFSSLWGIPESLFLGLITFLALTRLFSLFQRKAEFDADNHTIPDHEPENSKHFVEGLTRLHKEALIPAAMGKGGTRTHPDLYDRIESLGHPPDFPRPLPPNSTRALSSAFTTLLVSFLFLSVLQIAISLLFA